MEKKPPSDDPRPDPRPRKSPGTSLVARPQYIEVPAPEVIEEPSPGLLVEYWDIIRRHRGTLLVIAFLGLLASVLFTLPQTPIYRARASLEIQNLNENFLNMRNVNPTANEGGADLPEYDLQTQVKILQSESVLDRVIAKLNLEKRLLAERNRGRLSAWRNALGLSGPRPASAREEVLRLIAKNLEVHAEAKTRLVEVFYESTDPKLAADFVNTLTTEFIQQNLEARWKTTQQTGDWLTRQMEDVRIKLEKSEDELQSYANSADLVFTSEKDNVAEQKLKQLQEELSKAQADRIAKQSKYELASTAPTESLPEVLDDKTLGEYQVKLTDLRRQLAELSTTLTPDHPLEQKVVAQIAALEEALAKARINIIQRVRDEYESAQRREDLLTKSYTAQARLVSDQAEKVSHYNILKREVDTNRQLYDSLLRNVQEATMSSALRASNIRVVDSAQPPSRPYRPRLILNAALGLLAGAFFGLVFVVMRERADRSIQAPGETGLFLDVRELGVIPSVEAERSRHLAYRRTGSGMQNKGLNNGNGSKQVELVTWQRTRSLLADSFRSTLTSILCSAENGARPRIIVLTSASPREGKTTVASNLALALAEIRWPTLLVDGDLRKGRLHEVFQVSNTWGLSDLLASKKPPEGRESIVLGTGCRDLYLLPTGSQAPNISSLLYSPRAQEVLKWMRQRFQMVIIDTPPMLHMPDARVLARMADGVILVVRSAQTTREAAAAAAQRLREDGTPVLGTILNEWDPRKTSHTGYAYAYPYYRSYDNGGGRSA
jgi:succinoglycan biosynthesis transport protein ExoP